MSPDAILECRFVCFGNRIHFVFLIWQLAHSSADWRGSGGHKPSLLSLSIRRNDCENFCSQSADGDQRRAETDIPYPVA